MASYNQLKNRLDLVDKYIPFLQNLIKELEYKNDRSHEVQLYKMKKLHNILTNNDKR